jgi:hypothetical protein
MPGPMPLPNVPRRELSLLSAIETGKPVAKRVMPTIRHPEAHREDGLDVKRYKGNS